MTDGRTIVAMASAPGRSGVAVLRLSGDRLAEFAERLTGVRPEARHAHYVSFRDARAELLDRGLLLWFPAPHSYTGEDVLELHTHGGHVLPRRVLQACIALGARVAAPGEFTRRAFEHGKLDLVQAEAVADLIDAAGEAAARGALRSLSGAFSQRVRALQEALTALRVHLESGIDFPEEDLALADARRVHGELAVLRADLVDLLAEGQRGHALRQGREVVLLGAPNAGKSSLLNRLTGDDLAIVSAQPGTTRDAIRASVELGGLRLELIDTAGVRDGAEAVEKLGIERTWLAVARADLVLQLHAFDQMAWGVPTQDWRAQLPAGVPVIDVWTKADLADAGARAARIDGGGRDRAADPDVRGSTRPLVVSARTGEGMAELEAAVLGALGWSPSAEPASLARTRHLDGLRTALAHVEAALAVHGDELVAEDLRLAQRALDGILGVFAADDLLGEIFARFCIGK